ncbi:hypothetical protein AX15_003792 [Amanita polypyramis BW_CC]|nr:hypothetical protein AX15_003792 [Amanita polypyramis BW_CC]
MDTTPDFTTKEQTTSLSKTSSSNTTTKSKVDKGKEKAVERESTPLLSSEEFYKDYSDDFEAQITRSSEKHVQEDMKKFGFSRRNMKLKYLYDGMERDILDDDSYHGYYMSLKDSYLNLLKPLANLEERVTISERKSDGQLCVIVPFKLYGDLLMHWRVTMKNVAKSLNTPFQGSMESIAWAHVTVLFDDRFKDTLKEEDFLFLVKGLHGILDETKRDKYPIDEHGILTFNKIEKIVQNVSVSPSKDKEDKDEGPSLLQQRCIKNRASEKAKTTSYDKEKIKDILTMASQLSNKLDISITDAFDKAEDILTLSQPSRRQLSRSRSCSASRGRNQTAARELIQQVPWHTAESPEKITELEMVIRALLDSKTPDQSLKKKIRPSTRRTAPAPLSTPPIPIHMLAKLDTPPPSLKQERVTWAPTPQIATIEEVPESLVYPSSSSESSTTKKIKANIPPTDSLPAYESASDYIENLPRGLPKPQSTSYASVASANNQEWQVVAKKKAMANVRAGTKPNQLFIRPQGQNLLNHFKPGL